MHQFLRFGVALFLSAAGAFASDLTISMRGTGKYNDGPQTQFWSEHFMRTNIPGARRDTMIDYDKGAMYTIDHNKKTIELFLWDDLEAAVEGMAKQFKNVPPEVLAMMPGGGGQVTVEEGGKVVVAGRSCKKWTINAGSMVFEMSNDPSLRPPVSASAYQRAIRVRNLMGAMGPMAMQMKKVGEEMMKIQGMPLKTRTVLPIVGEVTNEATEVKEGPIPASTFELPADYKTVDKGKEMLKHFKR